MEVPVSITQIVDGRQYAGRIQIGDNLYEFAINLSVAINEFDAIPAPQITSQEEALAGIKKLFGITLTKDGVPIELEAGTYGFLIATLIDLAFHFYNQPQTRSWNNELGQMAILHELGVITTFGMTRVWDIPDDKIPKQLLNTQLIPAG